LWGSEQSWYTQAISIFAKLVSPTTANITTTTATITTTTATATATATATTTTTTVWWWMVEPRPLGSLLNPYLTLTISSNGWQLILTAVF